METVINWKDAIDKPMWRTTAGVCPTAHAAGRNLVYDKRNHGDYRNETIFQWDTVTTMNRYFTPNDAWVPGLAFTTNSGAIGAGAYAFFMPSHGPNGVVGASPTTTKVTLAALPNSGTVGINQLANCGGRKGFVLRVIDVGAGLSGKIEEREIVANTAGTTPTVTLDSALTFTPTASTTRYEMLSGRIYNLGSGTTASGFFRAFDLASETNSAALTNTNLPATIGTDTTSVELDEQYVPYNRNPGEGMLVGSATYDANGPWPKFCLTATAIAAGTITGQASGGDASVIENEYAKMFQIRIVEDTVTPAAVGQRRKITSHTAGASPVYTLVSNWTTTPSANCKYVIELNNDVMLWTGTNAVTYSYAAGGFAADANWSTAAAAGGATQYANPGSANGAGCMACSAFSIVPDVSKNALQGHVFKWRGGASVTLELYNHITNTWSTIVPGQAMSTTLSTATCGVHDPVSNEGRYFTFSPNVTQNTYRFDMLTRTYKGWAYLRVAQSGTAAVGQRMAWVMYDDGGNERDRVRVGVIYLQTHLGTTFFDTVVIR